MDDWHTLTWRDGLPGTYHADGHENGAQPATADEADKGRKDHERRRHDRRESEAIEELGVGDPTADKDGFSLDERDGRVGTAKLWRLRMRE